MPYYIEIFLDSWFGQVSSQKLEKYTFSGGQGRVYKILVRPAPTFLAYSGGLGSHIMQYFFFEVNNYNPQDSVYQLTQVLYLRSKFSDLISCFP